MRAMQGPPDEPGRWSRAVEVPMPLPPIYFVNRESSRDRLVFMTEQFDRLGLRATRIVGAEPAELTDAQKARYCNPRAPHFLSPPQLCCTLGHVKAWRAFMETGAKRALILEDDAVLSERLPAFLNELPELPYDLIRIETSSRPHLTTEPVTAVAGIGLREFRSTGWATAGYLITRRGVETLLASPKLFDLPTDATLFCPIELPASSLRLAQVDPALCVQLSERPGVAQAAAPSSITSFLYPETFGAWWSIQQRAIRWGWIKAIDKLTRRDLKRRVIRFADDARADA